MRVEPRTFLSGSAINEGYPGWLKLKLIYVNDARAPIHGPAFYRMALHLGGPWFYISLFNFPEARAAANAADIFATRFLPTLALGIDLADNTSSWAFKTITM
jgi:hypothetical protein